MPNPASTLIDQAFTDIEDLGPFMSYLQDTTDEQWMTNFVRSTDGEKNCLFGHLYNFAQDTAQRRGEGPQRTQQYANRLWDAFEERWATTYKVYPINDGSNQNYPQATPKERCLAFLRALQDGTELNTWDSIEAEHQRWLKQEASQQL